jgi:hypothetical protein
LLKNPGKRRILRDALLARRLLKDVLRDAMLRIGPQDEEGVVFILRSVRASERVTKDRSALCPFVLRDAAARLLRMKGHTDFIF